MRQRAHPPARGKGHVHQRRLTGREPARSWEITSEKADMPDSTLSGRSSDELRKYPQHLQYQNEAAGRDNNRSSVLTKPDLGTFHTLFRNAHHVPDNRYEEYILGLSTRRKRQISTVTKTCCAHTCAGFSVVACLFLFFIGILLDTQPLFIKGVLPQQMIQTDDNSKPALQYLIPQPPHERLPSAQSAYRAAFAYFLTVFACFYAANPGWFKAQMYRRQKLYQDIPDHVSSSASTIPQFHQSDELDEAPLGSPNFRPSWWNIAVLWLTQLLYSRGWYTPERRRRNNDKRQAKTV
jgi:hypothetical protein